MKAKELPNLKYDFSTLSRGRLRTYNMLVDELERMEAEDSVQDDVIELEDDMLEMLAAAGRTTDYSKRIRKHKIKKNPPYKD